ncbi:MULTISPECIES: hypothetical protein [Polymorphospora]|uniref:Uncharacterized protein n=1 Tax=Polymorphospora lycopeni TaxID=3140240 RepID=A0ABV5CXK5_9ACTN
MSDEYVDPSGNTEAFQAFTQTAEPAESSSKLPLIIGAAVAAVVLLALVGWLALG